MKAVATDAGIEALQVRDLPLPEPGPGQVRVRVKASALNPADQKVLAGEFAGKILHGRQKPVVVGFDLAGTVDAAGPGADLAVGDEVFGFLPFDRTTRRGAFAEQVVAPAASLAKRPSGLTPLAACALSSAGITALRCLRDIGHVKPGQRVLVVGASGGVGSLSVGVGVKLGASVTGICSASAADFVKSLGASAVIVRGQTDPLKDTQRYDVILDAACAYSYGKMKHLLQPGGTYIATLPGPGLFLSMPIARLSGKHVSFVIATAARADFELLARWAGEGMKVPIDSTFPVQEVGKAFARLAKGGMKGRVVIDVGF